MASGGLCRQTSLKKRIHQTICPCSSLIRAQGMSSASLCRRVDCDASHCPQMGRVAGTSFGDNVPSEDLMEDDGAECCGAYSAILKSPNVRVRSPAPAVSAPATVIMFLGLQKSTLFS